MFGSCIKTGRLNPSLGVFTVARVMNVVSSVDTGTSIIDTLLRSTGWNDVCCLVQEMNSLRLTKKLE